MENSRMKRMFMQRTMMSALSLAMYSCVIPRAHAFDSSKWGHDAATSEWFRSLKNSSGESCCDYADGVRLEAPEWRELEDHSFEVFAREKQEHGSRSRSRAITKMNNLSAMNTALLRHPVSPQRATELQTFMPFQR